MGDQARMPFTMAVVHEVQRFGDIAPVGAPHMTSRDIEVQGFLIPKVGLRPSSAQLSSTCPLVAPVWPLSGGARMEPEPCNSHFHWHQPSSLGGCGNKAEAGLAVYTGSPVPGLGCG